MVPVGRGRLPLSRLLIFNPAWSGRCVLPGPFTRYAALGNFGSKKVGSLSKWPLGLGSWNPNGPRYPNTGPFRISMLGVAILVSGRYLQFGYLDAWGKLQGLQVASLTCSSRFEGSFQGDRGPHVSCIWPSWGIHLAVRPQGFEPNPYNIQRLQCSSVRTCISLWRLWYTAKKGTTFEPLGRHRVIGTPQYDYSYRRDSYRRFGGE